MLKSIRAQLDRDGYVVVDDLLWPEECNELREAAMKFTSNLPPAEERAIFSSTEKSHLKDQYFFESNDKIHVFFEDKALDEKGDIKVFRGYCLNKVGHAVHLLHPLFRCYTYCDRVKNVVRHLGMRRPAVAQSMIIYKNPGIGGEVLPHQDATYLYTDPLPPIGFWIALEDADINNGCIWIIPGSHKSGVHRRLIRNPDPDSPDKLIYDKPPPIYPESGFVAVPVKKGSCLILHGNVVHKSMLNSSGKGRPAYTFHVIETDNNTYAPENWLQEGSGAPFLNMYETQQLV